MIIEIFSNYYIEYRHAKFLTQEGEIKFFTSYSGNSSVVELYLAKVDVAGSNPVSRSIFLAT